MNMRRGVGIIAVAVAIAVYFLPGAAGWLAVAALSLATVAAVMRQHLLALAVVILMVLKMAVVEPTLWMILLGDVREGDRTVDAMRVFLVMLMIAPLVAVGVNQVHSRLTDKLTASVAMLFLVAFIVVMIVHVPQTPMIIVFVVAVAMGIFDFWRELRSERDINDT